MEHRDNGTAGNGPGIEADEQDLLENRISLIVHRLNSSFTQVANRLIGKRGINMYDSRILLFLLEHREMRVGELAEAMALPQSTISHQLTRLKRRKLIHRRRTRGDNRAVAITLTATGEEFARDSEAFSQLVQNRIAAEFSPAELAELRRNLNKVLSVLRTAELQPELEPRDLEKALPEERRRT